MEAQGYTPIKKLGEGGFGKVWQVEKDGKFFAIKKIDKAKLNPDMIELIHKEIKLTKEICECESKDNCKDYVLCYDSSFEDNKYIYIVTGLIEGKELFDVLNDLIDKKNLPPNSTPKSISQTIYMILYKLTEDIIFIHKKGIIHKDLKIENVMVSEKDLKVILIDFGFACKEIPDYKGDDKCSPIKHGTPHYIAPEIMKGLVQYGKYYKADIFALGVIFNVLTSGYFPFDADSDREVIRKITLGRMAPIKSGNDAMDSLITDMLKMNPVQRPNAEEIIKRLEIDVYEDLEAGQTFQMSK